MEKLEKLEYELKESHQQRRKRGKSREVTCHKCEQPGHYANKCTNISPRVSPTTCQTEEDNVSPSRDQVCDSNCARPIMMCT